MVHLLFYDSIIHLTIWYWRLQNSPQVANIVAASLRSGKPPASFNYFSISRVNLANLSIPESFVQDNVSVDDKRRLPDSVDELSRFIVSCLQLLDPWGLSLPVAAWKDHSYCEREMAIRALKVTNDVAERGLKLIQYFASSLRTKET